MKVSMVYNIPNLMVTRKGKFFLVKDLPLKDESECIEVPINSQYRNVYAKLILDTFIGLWDGKIKYVENLHDLSISNLQYDLSESKFEYTSDMQYLSIDNVLFKRIEYSDYFISKNGIIYSKEKDKFLQKVVSQYGYSYCRLILQEEPILSSIQRILYRTWIGEIPEGKHVNHIDSMPWHNDISNYNLMTPTENVRYSIEQGNRTGKWNEEEIRSICVLLEKGKRPMEIYTELKFDEKTEFYDFKILLHHLKNKTKFWTDITSEYNFDEAYNKNSRHPKEQIHKICKMLEDGYSNREIADELDINEKYVSAIFKGTYFPEISSQYNIPKIDKRKFNGKKPRDKNDSDAA